jgi:hypothetical protein
MDDKQPAIMEEEAFVLMMIEQHAKQLHVLEKRLAQLRDRRRQEAEIEELFEDVKQSEKAAREHVALDPSPPPPPPSLPKPVVHPPRSRTETEAVFDDFEIPPPVVPTNARLDRIDALKRQAVESQKRREAALLEKKRVRSTKPSLERSNSMIGRDGYIEPPAPRPPPPPQPWYGGGGRGRGGGGSWGRGNWTQRGAPWTTASGGGRFQRQQQQQNRQDDHYGSNNNAGMDREFRKFSATSMGGDDEGGGNKRYKRDY